jgi:hypothetical protein
MCFHRIGLFFGFFGTIWVRKGGAAKWGWIYLYFYSMEGDER